ncbi:MAG: hypothetical protein IJW79_00350 [Clostridia bacterium]|nr:hypothetical protein [Clostridia bacterium]
MMICNCGGNAKVIYNVYDGENWHRKRKCEQCGQMIYTVEVYESKNKYNIASSKHFRRRRENAALTKKE